jgi:hypothetical protein
LNCRSLAAQQAQDRAVADTEQNFEQVHFETADELMRVLMPACGLDTGTGTPTFIYRGHGDVGWDLIPTALRLSRGGLTQALAHVEPNLQMTADEQVFAEMLLLMALMNSCDRAVIALPGDSHEFRGRWMDLKSESLEAALKTPSLWPYEQQLGLLAFAQHHGVPTRLLDWTHSAVVAAYFAAEASWRLGIQADLAVWALNTEYLHVYANLELVQMPGANSVRLGAQRGLFTCVRLTAGRGQPMATLRSRLHSSATTQTHRNQSRSGG